MIKLTKSNKPNVLIQNAEDWTNTLLQKLNNNLPLTSTEKTRYRHPEIKAALVSETNGKCAYCESKLQHIHHGDVEHIFPKSLAPEKTFEWENLTFACEICNKNKSNKDPNVEYIIDPYHIDPAAHLFFMGSFVFTLGTSLGKNSTEILDLNRITLCEQRKEKLEKVMGIFDTILRKELPLVVRKTIYNNLLANEGSTSSEYSAMINSAILAMKGNLPKELVGLND